jgi:ParB/RepB/Spo0J family partition protein
MSNDRQSQGYLKNISPDKISRNPDNPRLFFRPEELGTLMASIRRYGIQVPITVYEDSGQFVLIDGERRWRCARKLNLERIPALIQPKPTSLNNLLLMFNIHALREQWDYLTIANKLPDVISLYRDANGDVTPSEQELSELTGLTRGQIRRCRVLFDLPSKYRKLLEEELALPKQMQSLSEDFFIEMERALKTVSTRIPDAIQDKNVARDVLISKFRSDLIGNITDFRKLSKIATSVRGLGVKESKARSALNEIFDSSKAVGISDVFAEQFEIRYDERKISLNVESIFDYLESVLDESDAPALGKDLRARLKELRLLIEQVLES